MVEKTLKVAAFFLDNWRKIAALVTFLFGLGVSIYGNVNEFNPWREAYQKLASSEVEVLEPEPPAEPVVVAAPVEPTVIERTVIKEIACDVAAALAEYDSLHREEWH